VRGIPIAGDDEHRPLGSTSALEGIDGTGSDLTRLLSLSDGVFAFAMTFLAVTLLLPQVSGVSSEPALTSYLTKLQPAFVGYVLSFFVIAGWWSSHHRLFSSIVRYDGAIVRYNSFVLLVISVTPFLVSLLFAYSSSSLGPGSLSGRLAVAIFAAVQGLGGLALLAIWHHASRGHRLLRPSLPEGWIRSTEYTQLLKVGVFFASVGIAFVSPLAAELSWIVMIIGIGHRFRSHPVAPRRRSDSPPG
jgi:uncharacterized membrane protein